jgi:hypothetical protein
MSRPFQDYHTIVQVSILHNGLVALAMRPNFTPSDEIVLVGAMPQLPSAAVKVEQDGAIQLIYVLG